MEMCIHATSLLKFQYADEPGVRASIGNMQRLSDMDMISALCHSCTLRLTGARNVRLLDAPTVGGVTLHPTLTGQAGLQDDRPAKAAEDTPRQTEEKDPEAVTKKFGLEAGLFSALRNDDPASKASAKDLLKRYGVAYLATSITLALISFSLCYVAIDAGIDVPTLLSKVGITVAADSAGDKAGTVALAYAAHKALSPVRFPPTVALTPLVAQRIGKTAAPDGSE